MKLFVVAAALACVVLAIAKPLSDEHKEKIKQAKKECIAETGVAEDVVKKAKCDGIFADDPKLGEFFVCFFKKPGFMNDAGEYQVDTIKTILTDKYGKEVAENIITECTKETHGSAKENALHLAKCYHEHKPKVDHEKH